MQSRLPGTSVVVTNVSKEVSLQKSSSESREKMLSFDPVGGNLLVNYSVMLVAARLKFHNSFVIGHLRFVCDVRSLFVWCRWLL